MRLHFFFLSMAATILVLLTLCSGCRTAQNVQWARKLSATDEYVNARACAGSGAVTSADLKSRLAFTGANEEPDAVIAVRRLSALLRDEPRLDWYYRSNRDWVLGRLWERFAANTGRPTESDWRLCPEFVESECWLYVELMWPTLQKHADDTRVFRDEIVHAYVVNEGRVLAAVRFKGWRAKLSLDDLRERGDAAWGDNPHPSPHSGD